MVYISGGTSGINLGIAKGFAARGAKVLVFGRDASKAESAAAEIEQETGGRAISGGADVRNYAAVESLFCKATAEIGAPTVVIAGAAANFMAPSVDLSPGGFRSVVDTDLMGTYHVFRAGFDIIGRPGSMIAITSGLATHPMPQQVHACAAKAGVNMVIKVLAMEWGQVGIRVNGISPGPIAGSGGLDRLVPTLSARDAIQDSLALRRFGSSAEVAHAAIFLSSPEAAYITGTILECDGGMALGNSAGEWAMSRRAL